MRSSEETNLGNTILQSLGAASAQGNPPAGIQPNAAEFSAGRVDYARIEELLTKVAHQVLATDTVSGQRPEVRVQVAPDLMPGTEVKVWKADGGRLHVEFETTSPQWAKILTDASSILADRLAGKVNLGEMPVVIVQNSSQNELSSDRESSRDRKEDNEHGESEEQPA